MYMFHEFEENRRRGNIRDSKIKEDKRVERKKGI